MRMRNATGVIANVDAVTAERLTREGWALADAKPETVSSDSLEIDESTGELEASDSVEGESEADAKPETVKRKPGRPKKGE